MRTNVIEDLLTIVSRNIYDSAAEVMNTASSMIPANTFCIAINNRLTTTVLKSYNRENMILAEGLVVDNEESYCHLVIEKSQGPLIIANNLTHPFTREMDATKLVGGCSFMGVPIVKRGGEVYGSLCAFDHNFYSYSEKEVALMTSLATFFANVLELEDTADALKDAQHSIYNMVEEKSNMLAVMSHEIRTPLNGIIGMIDLLQTTAMTEEQREYVDIVQTSGNSLLALLNDILSYSKIEADPTEANHQLFNLRSCIKQVQDLFVPDASKKGITLEVEVSPAIPDVLMTDVTKIQQIIINLVSNAIKFTSSGGVTITVHMISSETENLQLLLTVRDTGIGIQSEFVDRLFQPFSQLHIPNNIKGYSGTGLGLYICKRLAEQLGGRLWLMESNEKGSCFAFELPLHTEKMST
jgi:signal transduction histidine kinase